MRFISMFLAFLILSCHLYGQTNETTVDSLERVLKRFPSLNKERVDALNDLGYRYWIVNSNKSVLNGTEALTLAKKLVYPQGIAKAKRVLGVAYWTLGKPKLALENLTDCQKTYEEVSDLEGAANCLMNSGMVYADIGDLDKALDIYERSIEKFTQLDLKSRIATTFNKIGLVLMQKNQLTEAKEYLTNALNMHSDDKFFYGMAEAHSLLGRLFILENELEQADYHLKKATTLGETVNDVDGFIGNLIQYGKLQRLKGEYEDSENHLLEALEKAEQNKLRKYILEAYQELKLLKKEQGQLEESLSYYDAFINLRDSIYDIDKSKQIAALEFNNELTNKEKEIELLQETKHSRTLMNVFLSLLLVTLAITALLMLRHQKQREKRETELLKSKEALARTELENAALKQRELRQQLEFKNKELTSYTLNFAQKNELFLQLLEKINLLADTTQTKRTKLLSEIKRTIKQQVNVDRDWEDFRRHFEEVHTDFYSRLKELHPDISANDLKISSLTRLNLNIKETANILGISPESVKTARYRLRKKLGIEPDKELLDYFLDIEKA
ncbi:tetratricopeptide repeat protein [Allomuricauda sp. SCSIO 65647]|uniref:tetratricopeptide repeat protein n=1 Tax=Allomuricauda sp. SCSIO 65647 TaxID=2908843 RepID=UPI001F15F8EA|nr:tetratricopeptide repeat protein [Muricauda sp. SCSIO 65647]UJH68285.1 tetratricopeptide repeat protein [Muricauda sp. SCSIO 65647]